MFKWIFNFFRKTNKSEKEKSPETKIYVCNLDREVWFKDKIKELIKNEKIKEEEILFVSFNISKFKNFFSNLKIDFLNPWTLKSIKENNYEKYRIICFDEFCEDPNGIFKQLVKYFLDKKIIVFGVVSHREYESEAYKQFKILFPIFGEPLIEKEKSLKDKEFEFEFDALLNNEELSEKDKINDNSDKIGGLY